MSFRSDFDDGTLIRLAISAHDPASDGFPEVSASRLIAGRKEETVEWETEFDFRPGRLYRIEIGSPSFVPDERLHNGDTRRLGLAVFSISIRV